MVYVSDVEELYKQEKILFFFSSHRIEKEIDIIISYNISFFLCRFLPLTSHCDISHKDVSW